MGLGPWDIAVATVGVWNTEQLLCQHKAAAGQEHPGVGFILELLTHYLWATFWFAWTGALIQWLEQCSLGSATPKRRAVHKLHHQFSLQMMVSSVMELAQMKTNSQKRKGFGHASSVEAPIQVSCETLALTEVCWPFRTFVALHLHIGLKRACSQSS